MFLILRISLATVSKKDCCNKQEHSVVPLLKRKNVTEEIIQNLKKGIGRKRIILIPDNLIGVVFIL